MRKPFHLFLCLMVTSICFAVEFEDPLENVVHFSPASSGIYLGSPTLLRILNGDILVGMDMFGPNQPEPTVSLIFRSKDDGESWRFVTSIKGSFWANLFVHRGDLYYLGISNPNGSLVIRKSEDNGETWTEPTDSKNGLIMPEGEMAHYHCAPMPVLEHDGRLYRAFENNATRQWAEGFRSFVISADVDADLLDADSWRVSNQLVYDQETDPPAYSIDPETKEDAKNAGWLEGNVVLSPEGKLLNILRVNSAPVVDQAAVVEIHDEGRRVTFDPETGFVDFPGGMTKFTIRYDEESGRYWTIANDNSNPKNATQRNRLSLLSSPDLKSWTHHVVLLEDLDDYENIGKESKVGFQYIDFRFDGDDIMFLSRTAYDGANNYHDANYMTFHRIKNFRKRF